MVIYLWESWDILFKYGWLVINWLIENRIEYKSVVNYINMIGKLVIMNGMIIFKFYILVLF